MIPCTKNSNCSTSISSISIIHTKGYPISKRRGYECDVKMCFYSDETRHMLTCRILKRLYNRKLR